VRPHDLQGKTTYHGTTGAGQTTHPSTMSSTHALALGRPPQFPHNWLQVLGTAECTQIYQRVRHQFHAVVSLLDAFKAEQQPLEFVLPRKGALDAQA